MSGRSWHPPDGRIFFGKDNTKLGRGVLTISRRAGLPENGGTCPGATTGPHGCLGPGTVHTRSGREHRVKQRCYFMRGHCALAAAAGLYDANSTALAEDPRALGEALDFAVAAKLGIRPGLLPVLVRGHVGGDFDTPAYVQAWVEVLRRRPWATFFAFTRSWRFQCQLMRDLGQLRQLPNVQVFASMDMGLWNARELPWPGYRVAWMGEPPLAAQVRYNLVRCPQTWPAAYVKHLADCAHCGFCWRTKPAAGIWFPVH